MNYTEKAQEIFNETKSALKLIYDELNQGQQKKIIKNLQVKTLLERYEVIGTD